jgi:pimeloyl-ACP methyl ester carboxylesterase
MAAPPAAPVQTGRRTIRSRLFRIVRSVLVVYLGVVLVLLLLENWLVYHPTPAEAGWKPVAGQGLEEIRVTAGDSTAIHALWAPRPESNLALLYCHGNAGSLQHRVGAILELRKALDVSVLIFDYPGYGLSEGKPSEAGCYAAADAAYDWLAQRVPPERIVLYGKSLGGGVAVDLAARRPHHALVLLRTFTSMPDVGSAHFPWLPARWLMRNRYDNLSKIGSCSRPIFVAHGDRDELVPLALGQRLYEAAGEPKQFYLMDGGHNDPIPPGCLAALADFLHHSFVGPPSGGGLRPPQGGTTN